MIFQVGPRKPLCDVGQAFQLTYTEALRFHLASPSLKDGFLVHFGPLGLMQTRLPWTGTVNGRGQTEFTIGLIQVPTCPTIRCMDARA